MDRRRRPHPQPLVRLVAFAVPALLACWSGAARSQSVTLYDAGGFESFTPGPLGGAGQDGWAGTAFEGAGIPEVVDVGGSRVVRLAVPAREGLRRESRVVKTFSPSINLNSYSTLIIELDLTVDADGNGLWHNTYFDFDAVPNKFLPDVQGVLDDGRVQMARGGSQSPGTAAPGRHHLRWVFDLTTGRLSSRFGDVNVDVQASVWLSGLTGGSTLQAFSLALVADHPTNPPDQLLLDNFVVTALKGLPAERVSNWTLRTPYSPQWTWNGSVNGDPTHGMLTEPASGPGSGGYATWVVSDATLAPHARFSANLYVSGSAADNDFMGIVFGYQNDNDFFLLDWKKTQETEDWGDGPWWINDVAERGIKLKRISGSRTLDGLWSGEDGTGITTLVGPQHDAALDREWTRGTVYRFDFDLSPGRIQIRLGGQVLITWTGSAHCGGKVGLYSFSQNYVALYDVRVAQGPRMLELTSSGAATAYPVTGAVPVQVATLNAGPPPPDAGWQPVARHADLHTRTAFACGTGGIVGHSDTIEVLPAPVSTYDDALVSNTHIRAFAERTNHVLAAGVVVDITQPGTYALDSDLPGAQVVPGGTRVSNYLLHFDTVGNEEHVVEGSVTFDTEIVGVAVTGWWLATYDGIVGAPGVTYPTGYDRGIEFGSAVDDIVTISQDRRTLTLRSRVNDHNDQLRVFVRAGSPDPLAEPYVDAVRFLDLADEVTFDNCGSAFYRFTFDLPQYRNARLAGVANADDIAAVYLNGVRLSPALLDTDAPGADRLEACVGPILSAATRDQFAAVGDGYFRAGENELVFAVHGDAGGAEPTGVEFWALVDYEDLEDVVGVGPDRMPNPRHEVTLNAPWPNPTRGGARLSYSLATAGPARVSVHDVAGRLIRVVREGHHEAGPHQAVWDGRDAGGRPTGSGVFFARVAHGSATATRRVLVIQ